MAAHRASRLLLRAIPSCPHRFPSRAFATTSSLRAQHVRIVEVGPRDGLQNEKKTIPVATKIELVERLAATGLQTIEAGAFVSPKWVPQMANSSEIFQYILQTPPPSSTPITYQWLLPNVKGLENLYSIHDNSAGRASSATTTNAYPTPPSTPTTETELTPPPSRPQHEISIFTAATDTFSIKNTNATTAETLLRFRPIFTLARDRGTRVRAYISVALGCPYEGPDVDPHRVAELCAELLEMGADEVSVADTTGMGTAPRTKELLRTLSAAGIRNEDLAFHFHDTYGQALVNTVVALEHGIRTFDGAVGGLGGCPYSPGATGNVATEDLVHCLHSLGMSTGVDIQALAEIGAWITGEIGKGNESRAGKATLAKVKDRLTGASV